MHKVILILALTTAITGGLLYGRPIAPVIQAIHGLSLEHAYYQARTCHCMRARVLLFTAELCPFQSFCANAHYQDAEYKLLTRANILIGSGHPDAALETLL